MRAIILINFGKIPIEALDHLIDQGITPVFLPLSPPDQTPEKLNISGCIFQSKQDIWQGKFPKELSLKGYKPIIPDPELLVSLAEYERVLFPMMEKLNFFNQRIRIIIQRYRTYVANWLGIIHALKPEVIIFPEAPHDGFDYVLYSLAQVLKVTTVMPERTLIKDRFFILKSIHEFPKFPNDYKLNQEIDTELLDKFQGNQRKVINRERSNAPWSFKSLLSRLLHLHQFFYRSKKFHRDFDSAFALSESVPMNWQQEIYTNIETIKALRLKRWYSKNCCDPDLQVPYVYFPLSVQPERTTLPMGKEFWDPSYVLDMLLESLPKGWRIYIKEHPRQFTRAILRFSLARDRDFYTNLLKDKRVSFVNVGFDSKILTSSAKCLVTITGSAGWEAIINGTPCLIFGSPWFKECPEVVKVENLNNCIQYFKDLEEGKIAVDQKKIKNFIAWVKNEGGYIGNLNPVLITSFTKSENARHFANAIVNSVGMDN